MRILNLVAGTLASAVLLGGCTQSSSSAPIEAKVEIMAPSVLTIMTRTEPETQLMALILTKASADKGNPVRILLCGGAGDIALKQPPAISQVPLAPKNMSPAGLLSKLIDGGVQVDVCAIYLPNRDFGKEALQDKVGVATPADIAAYFTQHDAKILSF